MSIDPNNLSATAHLTFDDEFTGLSLWNGTSGTWATSFWYQDPNGNGASLTSNGEQEWYINSQYAATAQITPWTVSNGVLTLTASPTAAWLKPLVNNYSYVSGELNTYHSFAQTYGYFEMKAELPKGQGFWPAFWLMPENGAWPPELDVAEVLGQNPSGLVTTVHTDESGSATMYSQWNQVADTSAGYHTYGVDWEPDYITWYFDDQPIYKVATPSDMNSPMYMIVNLAVGGYWPGSADGTSSAQMEIDYVRAYASGAAAGVVTSPTPTPTPTPAPTPTPTPTATQVQVSAAAYTAPSGVTTITLTGSNQTIQANNAGDTIVSDNSVNHLQGGSGNDTFLMGRGGDNAASGGGADVFKFTDVPWAGGHITGFTTGDSLDVLSIFTKYGYAGSNPLADGHLNLVSDGQGDTQVWAVMGSLGAGGSWLITTLDKVAPTSLAWSNGALVETTASSSSSGSTSTSTATGHTFTSDNNGDHWTGTTGADVFNLGRGGDVVTGNGGADVFKFAEVPWAGGHITDFGSDDTLDLSAMMTHYGYAASDPNGRITFTADGQGGTDVWFNMAGLAGSSGSWLVTDLDKVAASSLHLSNGVVTESASSSSTTTAGSIAINGQTFTSDNNGDHWTGTANNDLFLIGRGGDTVTGGAGSDVFEFKQLPWAGGHITDFTPGQDQIDLAPMFASYSYTAADPVADGRLKLVSDGAGSTQVWFDADGLPSGSGTWLLTTLDHVAPTSLHVQGGWITG